MLEKNLVFKIFEDKAAYEAAVLAENRLHKNPEFAKTEAMIYDVGILGKMDNHNVYYYLMEKMDSISNSKSSLSFLVKLIAIMIENKKDLFKDIKNNFKINKTLNLSDEEKDKLKLFIKETKINIEEKEDNGYLSFPNDQDLKNNWLEVLIEEILIKYLTGRTDLHMGNIGKSKSGYFRYFDPAYYNHVSKINI